jgi:hypothetical protein
MTHDLLNRPRGLPHGGVWRCDMRADTFISTAGVPAFSHRESDDGYFAVVARLNERWRVIVCKDGIQWVLQFAKKRRDRTAWEGRSYCRTREALIRVSSRHAGPIDPHATAILEALPRMIGIGGGA